MTRHGGARRWAWIALAAVVVASSACGDGDAGDAGTSAPAETGVPATSTTAAAATTAPTAVPATTEPATTAPATTAPATTTSIDEPADGACLVGDWFIDEDQMNVFFDALADPSMGLDFTVVGGTALSFTADTYEYLPEFTLEVSLPGITGTGDVTGSVRGSYVAVDGVVTTSNEDNDLGVTIRVAGQTIDGSDATEGLIASSPVNDAPYDCSGPEPVIFFATSADPVPILLRPR